MALLEKINEVACCVGDGNGSRTARRDISYTRMLRAKGTNVMVRTVE